MVVLDASFDVKVLGMGFDRFCRFWGGIKSVALVAPQVVR